jgi:hypothetical protein
LVRLLTVVALVAASTAAAACEWGDKEPPQARRPATPTPVPFEVVVAVSGPSGCGDDVSLTLDAHTPLGETFVYETTIITHVWYRAPNCTRASVQLRGFHHPQSAWYEYWCVRDDPLQICTEKGIPSFITSEPRELTEQEGHVGFRTIQGPWRGPWSLSSRPNFNGFTLCAIDVTLNDGVYASHTQRFLHLEDGCEPFLRVVPTPTPMPVPPTAAPPEVAGAAGTCGQDVLLEADTSALGRTFGQEDAIITNLRYRAPHCRRASVALNGFHGTGSPWYEHWCGGSDPLDICRAEGIRSFIRSEPRHLLDPEGALDLVTRGGFFPPGDGAAPPNFDGFTLCMIEVTVNDGAWGGASHTEYFMHLDDACEPYLHVIP